MTELLATTPAFGMMVSRGQWFTCHFIKVFLISSKERTVRNQAIEIICGRENL